MTISVFCSTVAFFVIIFLFWAARGHHSYIYCFLLNCLFCFAFEFIPMNISSFFVVVVFFLRNLTNKSKCEKHWPAHAHVHAMHQTKWQDLYLKIWKVAQWQKKKSHQRSPPFLHVHLPARANKFNSKYKLILLLYTQKIRHNTINRINYYEI